MTQKNVNDIVAIFDQFENLDRGFLLYEFNGGKPGKVISASAYVYNLLQLNAGELIDINNLGTIETSLQTSFHFEQVLNKGKHQYETTWKINRNQFCSVEVESILNEMNNKYYIIETVKKIDASRSETDKIQEMIYDEVTGLPKEYLFKDRLNMAIAQADRRKAITAIFYLYIDGFSHVSSNLGEVISEQFVSIVTNRILSCFRKGDTVSRLGEQKFGIVLPDMSKVDAEKVATRLIKVLSRPYRIEDYEINVTPFIGISLFPYNGRELSELVSCAEKTMEMAKDEKNQQMLFFDKELHLKKQRLHDMENALRMALDRNEFTILYQPQVSLNTGSCSGLEALLRWNHSQFGEVSPATFIPIAEDTGLIVRIGKWVLEAVCHQIKEWEEFMPKGYRVGVNLSLRQLMSHFEFFDMFMDILEESKADPTKIELEITESLMINATEKQILQMNELRQKGVSIAIDDFGTGYSSLDRLTILPFDKLKLDKSFIDDMSGSTEKQIVVASLVDLAHKLNRSVIAEGVEYKEHVTILKSYNCDFIQGNYISKPLPVHVIEKNRNTYFSETILPME